MIDLHLHTTASDGRSSPESLVAEAAAAGVTAMAVTDHDTVAAVAVTRTAAVRAGIDLVAGIEITAVDDGRDVHVLGYFVDDADADLLAFLVAQRASRRERVADILARLDSLGVGLDAAAILGGVSVASGRAIGRPAIARALVAAGHVRDIGEAFDRYLAPGRPAFAPRVGPSPKAVVQQIRAAGGLASLAHPAKLDDDDLVGDIVRDGIDAIEVYHPDHDDGAMTRYHQCAAANNLLVTGGSDYHGPGSGRTAALGHVGLSDVEFARLAARAARGQRA